MIPSAYYYYYIIATYPKYENVLSSLYYVCCFQPGTEYEFAYCGVASFLEEYMRLNPTGRTSFKRDEVTKRFQSCFILFPGIAPILEHFFEHSISVDMGFIITRFGHGGQMIKMVISTMEHSQESCHRRRTLRSRELEELRRCVCMH